MRNKVYYTIFNGRTMNGKKYMEYHVSHDKQLVRQQEAMSHMIPLDSPGLDRAVAEWKEEARVMQLINVETPDTPAWVK